MATRYACQHRTSRRFLALRPSLGHGHHETDTESEACSFATMAEATMELFELGEFMSAWDVVPVEVEMQADYAALMREESERRRQAARDAGITIVEGGQP